MISKRRSNASVMKQEFSDDAIVAMKLGAYEGTVTYLRIKLLERAMKVKVKGGTSKRGDGTQI